MRIVKEYGVGNEGTYSKVFLFKEERDAQRKMEEIFLEEINMEWFVDLEDLRDIKRLFNGWPEWEREQDDRYASIVYHKNKFFSIIDDNYSVTTFVDIEPIFFSW